MGTVQASLIFRAPSQRRDSKLLGLFIAFYRQSLFRFIQYSCSVNSIPHLFKRVKVGALDFLKRVYVRRYCLGCLVVFALCERVSYLA